MAEALLTASLVSIVQALSDLKPLSLGLGLRRDLEMLRCTISEIKEYIKDAEDLQQTNLGLKHWLERMKLVMYDGGNLLDEIATEGLRRRIEIHGSTAKEVLYFFTRSNPFLFRLGVGQKVKDLRKRLAEIASERENFGFSENGYRTIRPGNIGEETTSFVLTSEVIGRENDKDAFIRLLISSALSDERDFHIIPIVGMGGLGKTTLAQLVFNDEMIRQHFSMRTWVYVSHEFGIRRILIALLRAAGDSSSLIGLSLDKLQNHVRHILISKRFLLVLDDLRTVDPNEWEMLQYILMEGGRGSRVIVTTQNMNVASLVCTIKPYELEGLSEDECLAILVKWAFKRVEDSELYNLLEIGKEISKKCCGVPLAARTFGVELYSRTSKQDWLSVRDTEMWTQVQSKNTFLSILKSSYDEMPWVLKQFFVHCSLFEKDQIISKEQLIYGLAAHGYLQSGDEDTELESMGERLINELVSRYFIIKEQGEGLYKIHRLVHDLAKYVAGQDYFTMTRAKTETISDRVRHVSFDLSFYQEFPRYLAGAKKLQTIVLPRNTERTFRSSFEEVILNFRYLRQLDYNRTHWEYGSGQHINVLPETIGNLKHLRYLAFHYADALPKSLCKLYNLQYLDLLESTLRELPEEFGELINLRFLRLSSNLTSLPEKVIGKLTSLRVLQLYDSYELRSLGEGIKHLTTLRQLVLWGCVQLPSLPAGFGHLTSLEHLEIGLCSKLKFSEDDFKGLTRLKKVVFTGLPQLESLPMGLENAATSLNQLHLRYCTELTTISDSILPNLKSLRVFHIHGCPKLGSLPEGMKNLTTLHHLTIRKCDRLSERCNREGEDWHKIAHVPQICIDTRNMKAI